MSQLPTGSQLSTDVSFNSGTLDINGMELAALQDITISLQFSTKDIRGLGSIKMLTAPKRYGWKPTAKAKTKSINQQLYQALMGSSNTDGSGFGYSLFDGQNVLARASIKCIINEQTGQSQEYQFTNAIISMGSLALKPEDAAEYDFSIEAQDVTVVSSGNF
jgi:hypothetical protein